MEIETYRMLALLALSLAPAMRSCQTLTDRIDDLSGRLSRADSLRPPLSGRLSRAGQLLRARVDVQLEAHNQELLSSMERRARLQLRLQETIEGLSIAAITYYGVSLISYALDGVVAAGLDLPKKLLAALSVPLVASLVWLGLRRVRRMIGKQEG